MDLDFEESAAEDQNSSTSDEEWDSGATAAKSRAGSKQSKAQGSKQGQSSCESTYKGRSSGVALRHEGTTPGETILHLQVIHMADSKSDWLVGCLPKIHVIIVNVAIYMQVPMCTYIKIIGVLMLNLY